MPAKKKTTVAKLAPLIAEVRSLIQSARHTAASTVNTLQVLTNFEIGRRIVEHEQKGKKRAGYGQELLKELSARLTEEFGKGFSRSNLQNMRSFFLLWQGRVPKICQQATGKLGIEEKHRLSAGESVPVVIFQQPTGKLGLEEKRQHPAAKLTAPGIQQQASVELSRDKISAQPIRKSLFTLSWTHYILLLTIKDPDERSFYEIEATSEGWSVPELKRQKASCLYERLALSRDKKGVKRLAEKGQIIARPEDVLKEPYILEFLGLDEKSGYSESNLETAIIDRIEHFLLELGKGFLFEARQKRFTFDEDHFFVDLVFYNRLLRCYVLIDLKLDKLTHQDLGQMQMYVNYFDRHVKLPEENPTIGMLLCKEKKDAVVKLTLPPDANIHAREYKLYLPSKEELKRKLLEWGAEQA